ncbi:predicted nucleoside-diphosphate-sugar epimerases [Vibrio variabilis]|uniref:Predicted nucleoside-diphosphate-sugar epimerases n=1 Tax=Vibrio variabilis TaxID=990271 RepID=A0ABQ0JHS0_9VIBR|nr:predicted nucleoside-diphosphate-sugar epimerases [Vibrio variabilis]
MHNDFRVMIAGASGLVGSKLLTLLEQTDHIESIYALCRSPLNHQHSKTTQIMDGALRVTQWDDSHPTPTLGFICLGTTLKKAGSKQALEKVDVDLVCDVAQTMKMVGVKRIAVVSSLGASVALFHITSNVKAELKAESIKWASRKWYLCVPVLWQGVKKRSDQMRYLYRSYLPYFHL